MKQAIVWSVVMAGLACGGFARAQSEQVHKIIHAKVTIDAAGHVSDASLVEKKVPPAVEAAVLARVKGWTFDPVMASGVAVPAVTYAGFYACAIKSSDGFDLSVKYIDSGPLLVHKDRLEHQPVVSNFSKADQSVVAKIKVREDGRVQLLDVVMVDIDPRVGYDMRLSIKHWVDGMRFTPEQIGGQAVATAMDWPISFWADTGEEHKPIAGRSPSDCDADVVARDSPHPVASLFKPHGSGTASEPTAR